MENVNSCSTGLNHTVVVKTDGSLWTFGGNFQGQLGDGTTKHSWKAKKIMSNVAQAIAGKQHTVVLKTDGTLWLFGNGQKKPVMVMRGIYENND